MSRIGKIPVSVPEKVEVSINGPIITVKWPLWELSFSFSDKVNVKIEEKEIIVRPIWEESAAFWGTTRAIISNMVEGVTNGFKKTLELQWVGYKFEVQNGQLTMSLGFSHKIEVSPPKGIKIEADEKEKNTIHIIWIDKQLVGEFAAKIRSRKKPEPYKGKWIRYAGEYVRRKAGKSGKK